MRGVMIQLNIRYHSMGKKIFYWLKSLRRTK